MTGNEENSGVNFTYKFNGKITQASRQKGGYRNCIEGVHELHGGCGYKDNFKFYRLENLSLQHNG